MQQLQQNKEFIIRYFNAMSSASIKTRELLMEYITDEELIGHILFFDTVFPKYEMVVDELTCEGNRIVIRSRLQGIHKGEFNGILPTHRKVDFPVVVGYEIQNEKIVHHWLIADSITMMEQLGVMNATVHA